MSWNITVENEEVVIALSVDQAAATTALLAAARAEAAENAAESARDTAITQAGIATTKAGEAATSASNALDAKNAAESARDTAITQAGIATTKASEALASQEAASISETNGLISEQNAAASAAIALTAQGQAEYAAVQAGTSASVAQQAANDAVAVVTGGTASQTPEAGKIPIANANGKIDAGWIDPVSGIDSQALHRSPNAVTAMFIYDTSKDSDGGAWTEKCQHTSWYNETMQGRWLGQQVNEASARAITGAATNDYYQQTSDGRFYRLNAGSGITEVFRGNKRSFPKIAGIVAEAFNVTIYDLTESGNPMWMVFSMRSVSGTSFTVNNIASLVALNGILAFGTIASNPNSGLLFARLIKDEIFRIGIGVNQGGFGFNVSQRNNEISLPFRNTGGIGNTEIPSLSAMYSQDSLIDPSTGLKEIHLAIVTGSGLRIWRSSRGFIFSSSTTAFTRVSITPSLLIAVRNSSELYYAKNPNSLGASFALSTIPATQDLGFGTSQDIQSLGRSKIIRGINTSQVKPALINIDAFARSINATISDLFNTGYMVGGIRRAYLSQVTVGNISNPETITDRSFNNRSATVFGTLSRTAVATGADLVAFSGFSNSNYLREPYSSELDFGTGEVHLSAWVNIPTNLPIPTALWQKELSKGINTPNPQPSGGAIVSKTGTVITVSGGAYAFLRLAATTSPGILLSDWQAGRKIQISVSTRVNSLSAKLLVVTPDNVVYISSNTTLNTWETTVIEFTSRASTSDFLQIVTGVNNIIEFDLSTLTIKEYTPNIIVSRNYSTGPYFWLYVTQSGTLGAIVNDGTTYREIFTPSVYNLAQWLKVEANYIAGRLALLINGVEVAATTGNPLLTLNNPDAVLTIGNNFELNAPFPGSLALVKLSATVPSAEQSLFMYEQEKQLFRENTKCILPDANTVTDLSYDEVNDQWIAISSENESTWTGLVRNSVKTPSAGAFSRVETRAGFKLMARTTTNIGVDVTKPSYGILRNMLRRAEDAARLTQELGVFEFVGGFTATTVNGNVAITSVANLSYPQSFIGARVSGSGIPANTTIVGVSGTTIFLSAAATASASNVSISFLDFNLPAGFDPTDVKIAGVTMREGATRDYIKLYDGFKQTVRFAVAPSATAWIQIICKKEIQ